MLEIKNITAEYNKMKALDNVTMNVEEGEFVSIVGSNGAGKSTLLKAISGIVTPISGEIVFRNANITQLSAHKRTRLGIIQIPEGRRIFPSLTIGENLELGAFRSEAHAFARKNLDTVLNIFPILKERNTQLGGTLSGGEQQMLAIARGLMANPKVLMLDEPSLGLSPLLADHIFETIAAIWQNLKFSILLVEQRAVEALQLCNRGYVMESGRITIASDRESLMLNPLVQKAYLGSF